MIVTLGSRSITSRIATFGPGFAAAEPAEILGQRVALPTWLEPQRRTLEAQLVPF